VDIAAPPVINVYFEGQVFGEIPPNTDDLLPLGSANDDNIFRFGIDAWQWVHNLGTKQFTAVRTKAEQETLTDSRGYFLQPGQVESNRIATTTVPLP